MVDKTTRINRVPLGLLDFLGTKAQGNNPSELLQQVRPTVDLSQFWLTERLELWTAIKSVPGGGQLAETIIVPTGEVWIPVQMAVDCTVVTTNDDFKFEFRLSNPQGGTQPNPAAVARIDFTRSDSFSNETAGRDVGHTYDFPERIVLGTDAGLTWRTTGITNIAAATNMVYSLLFYRFKT